MTLNKRYNVIYLKKFDREIYKIIYYMRYKLKNPKVARDLYKNIYDAIDKRTYNPEIYEKYKPKNSKNIWYRIYIKNYIIFYRVENNNMIISRIIYNKRNLEKIF